MFFIPNEFYVGITTYGYDHFLGLMSPATNDSADKGRRYTIDRSRTKNIPTFMLENKPRKGFKILAPSTERNCWLVQDPEGFVVNIPENDIATINSHFTVVNGEVQGELIYIRGSGCNHLSFEGSDLFEQSLPQDLITKRVHLKDVPLGSKVRLRNGTICRFFGKRVIVDCRVGYYRTFSMDLESSAKFVVYREKRKDIVTSSSIHIVEVLSDAPYSTTEIEKVISEANNLNGTIKFVNYRDWYIAPSGTKASAEPKLTITEISDLEYEQSMKSYVSSQLLCFESSGNLYYSNSNNRFRSKNAGFIDGCRFDYKNIKFQSVISESIEISKISKYYRIGFTF